MEGLFLIIRELLLVRGIHQNVNTPSHYNSSNPINSTEERERERDVINVFSKYLTFQRTILACARPFSRSLIVAKCGLSPLL